MRRRRKNMIFGRRCRIVKNKKGNPVLEGITILIVITIFAIGGLYAYQMFDQLNTDLQADTSMADNAKAVSGGLFNTFPGWLDGAFLFIFVMFILFSVISAFFIDSHPIFFFISIILLVAVFVVTALVGNVYHDIASDTSISSYANNLPYMYWVMNHILELIIVVSFSVMIALFVKFKGGM
jgi:hypothetical protein